MTMETNIKKTNNRTTIICGAIIAGMVIAGVYAPIFGIIGYVGAFAFLVANAVKS